MRTVPALSLHRPWTTFILFHGKDVENRSWPTSYRGPLLIHGAKPWSESAFDFAEDVDLAHDHELGIAGVSRDPADHPTGIVGTVTLVDVCNAALGKPFVDCSCGLWAMPNQAHWRLANPRPFAKPIKCPGRQQLWVPPADVAESVRAELDGQLLDAVALAVLIADPVPADLVERVGAALHPDGRQNIGGDSRA